MSMQAKRLLQLTTPWGADKLIPTKLDGVEYISQPFKFTLTAFSNDRNITLKNSNELLNKPVCVQIGYGHADNTRFIHGIVTQHAMKPDGKWNATPCWIHKITIEPLLKTLDHNKDCRIFEYENEGKDTLDIIEQLFAETDMPDFEHNVDIALKKRPHRTQYQESTLDFISRLLAEEGLSYYFKHTPEEHILVITNTPGIDDTGTNYTSSQPLNYEPNIPREQHISDWEYTQQTIPAELILADHDFEQSYTAQKDLIQSLPLADSSTMRTEFIYPGGYKSLSERDYVALITREQRHNQQYKIEATSTYTSIQPGMQFTLTPNAFTESNARYLITEIRHTAQDDNEPRRRTGNTADLQEYKNTFICIPADVTFRPQHTKHTPKITGAQTAIVTGPQNETINTEKYGRIQARFHWEHDSNDSQNRFFWLRTAYPWAGNNYGVIFTPRINQEVVTTFINGNPEQPVVIGCVYNEDNSVPYTLPAAKNKTVLRSSINNGARFNELSFDDTSDAQSVYLRAEKDYTREVNRDAVDTIQGNYSLNITGEQKLTVGSSLSTTVKQGTHTVVVEEGHASIKAQNITLATRGGSIQLTESGVNITGSNIHFNRFNK